MFVFKKKNKQTNKKRLSVTNSNEVQPATCVGLFISNLVAQKGSSVTDTCNNVSLLSKVGLILYLYPKLISTRGKRSFPTPINDRVFQKISEEKKNECASDNMRPFW